jgi:hypothetical protein
MNERANDHVIQPSRPGRVALPKRGEAASRGAVDNCIHQAMPSMIWVVRRSLHVHVCSGLESLRHAATANHNWTHHPTFT